MAYVLLSENGSSIGTLSVFVAKLSLFVESYRFDESVLGFIGTLLVLWRVPGFIGTLSLFVETFSIL